VGQVFNLPVMWGRFSTCQCQHGIAIVVVLPRSTECSLTEFVAA